MHFDANTATPISTSMTLAVKSQQAELEILQHAFTEVLNSLELREADPPMLDVLYALNRRFHDLLTPA